jgi:hypothetical protein
MAYPQKKIGNKIFLYGSVTNKLSGNILIYFPGVDASTEYAIIDKFKDHGARAMSYNNIFIPSVNYSSSEFSQMLIQNEITSIVYITLTDVSEGTYSYSNTNMNGSAYWTINGATARIHSASTSGTVMYTKSVSLNLYVYNIRNNFDKPVGVIAGEATGSGGVASTAKSITKKIMGRVVTGLVNEKAFE